MRCPERATGEGARPGVLDAELLSLLRASLVMVKAWADVCADPDFIKEKPLEAAALGGSVLARADRLVAMLKDPPSPHEP